MSGRSTHGTEGVHEQPEHVHHDAGTILARARAFAVANGLPFTSMRERVLVLLSHASKPLTAYEIAERLSETKKVQAVQVYRALDFLQEAGCVLSMPSEFSSKAPK
jgi:Fur family zinc uptake transcriptional regulator